MNNDWAEVADAPASAITVTISVICTVNALSMRDRIARVRGDDIVGSRESGVGSSAADPHRPALVLAAVALGHALQINNGFYTPEAIAIVCASLVLAWVAVLVPRLLGRVVPDRDGVVVGLLIAGLAFQLARLMTSPIGMYLDRPMPRDQAGFVPLLMVAALAIGVAAVGHGRWRTAAFGVLVAVHLGLATITIKASPNPMIDVVTVHRAAFRAIEHGRSPYSIVFRDIYGGRGDFYPPGAVKNGIVHFGYPYPIVSLLQAWPGQQWFGDFRYSELLSLSGGVIFIALAAGLSRVAVLALALLLFTPRGFFQLEQAWTEPLLVLWVGIALWAWRRQWMRLTVTAVAMTVAIKQYLVVAIPLAWLMRNAPWPPSFLMTPHTSPVPGVTIPARRWAHLVGPILVGSIAALTFVPVLLWDAQGFINSALLVQVNEKLRPDALSFAVTYAQTYGHELSTAAYGLIVLAAIALAAWRAPATPAGFVAALAVVLFTTFAFGKKAFCNYYFFVLATMCAAIAVSGFVANPREGARPPDA
jgi:hypothetical protein